MKEKKFDLDERLIDFAVDIIFFTESLPNTKAANHLGGQLLRSGTSPSLNYGEVKGAESQKDFVHKMKVCLKELRESYNCSRILRKAKLFISEETIDSLIGECNELISIFVKSIHTASNSKSNS
ncbi:MAG: four helix bundle protein [Cyclobacteriaceae bacterium]|nr:four helix bundle protein [Cyclobacteriaceae bacterium]